MLDQALLAGLASRELDPDDAVSYASEKRLFQKYIADTSLLPKLDVAAS